MAKLEPLTILLVEDDQGDQKLIKISLRRQKVANALCIVSSDEEGMDFLHRCGDYKSGVPRSDLILLDLKK